MVLLLISKWIVNDQHEEHILWRRNEAKKEILDMNAFNIHQWVALIGSTNGQEALEEKESHSK